MEAERKARKNIEEGLDAEAMAQEVQTAAIQIMEVYKRLHSQVNALDNDYNKSEDELFRELKEIEN